jgi:hypothetical protein
MENLSYAFYNTNRWSTDIPWADGITLPSKLGLQGCGPRLANFSKANFTSAFYN